MGGALFTILFSYCLHLVWGTQDLRSKPCPRISFPHHLLVRPFLVRASVGNLGSGYRHLLALEALDQNRNITISSANGWNFPAGHRAAARCLWSYTVCFNARRPVYCQEYRAYWSSHGHRQPCSG